MYKVTIKNEDGEIGKELNLGDNRLWCVLLKISRYEELIKHSKRIVEITIKRE